MKEATLQPSGPPATFICLQEMQAEDKTTEHD